MTILLGKWLSAVVLLVVSAGVVAEADTGLERFAGRWERVGHEADDRSRDAEIDRILADMNVFIRPIARAVMTRSMVPPRGYDIARVEQGLRVQPAGGDEEILRPPTEAPGRIVSEWEHGESSSGSTTWELDDDGETLRVSQVVRDGRLGGELRYGTTYARR